MELGLLFALGAILSWGFGDFFIQKSTRSTGVWQSLFAMTLVGVVTLIPFIWQTFFTLSAIEFGILCAIGIFFVFAAYFELSALKTGKLSVIEPIFTFEAVITMLCSVLLFGEVLSIWQATAALVLIISLFFVSWEGKKIEQGIGIGIIGAILMGVGNFTVGFGAKTIDPLMTKFFIDIFILGISAIILFRRKENMLSYFKKKEIWYIVILDNIAWVCFALALGLSSISIITGLTESYILITVLLGFFINKEKVKIHQRIAMGVAIVCAVALAMSL
jgi:drug/metabolite transporter (DMT)-like permease